MKVKEHLSIALVQFDIAWEQIDRNLEKLELMVASLEHDIDLIVFPETFNSGFATASLMMAETADGKTIRWMKELAVIKNCAVCGSLFIKEENKYFNRFCWVESNGNSYFYDKRHLFSMGGEDKLFTRGNKSLVIEYKGWKIFPQVCYDLRFPVWSRNINSYDLMINVANWPDARRKVWKTLLKARAIENQSYVVAVNRIGIDGNHIGYSGSSMVINPKGMIVFKANRSELIETVQLDYQFLYDFRKKFDTLKDGDKFTILG